MANSDYYDPNRPINSLEAHGIPSNPAERKSFEQQKAKEFEQQMKNASQQAPQKTQEQIDGERVFLVNNKARPLHITEGDDSIIFDGQLAVSSKGPFLQIPQKQLDQSYMLQAYMKTPLSKVNPHLKGKTVIEQLSEDEFRKRYSEYLKGKSIREAEYAKEHNNVARHEDGTIDDDDAIFELRKVNPKIVRAQG